MNTNPTCRAQHLHALCRQTQTREGARQPEQAALTSSYRSLTLSQSDRTRRRYNCSLQSRTPPREQHMHCTHPPLQPCKLCPMHNSSEKYRAGNNTRKYSQVLIPSSFVKACTWSYAFYILHHCPSSTFGVQQRQGKKDWNCINQETPRDNICSAATKRPNGCVSYI
eukprot:1157239-Pelagomonas_calceolata.AAC.12